MAAESWPVALPLIVLVGGAVIAFLAGRALGARGGDAAGIVAIVAFALSFAAVLPLGDAGGTLAYAPFGEAALLADGLAVFLALVATGLGLAVAAYSLVSMRGERGRAHYTALLLLMVAGLVGLGFAGDLFNLYVFFELMAISSYALVAFHRERGEAIEAGMKYIVMSGAGSLLALLGIGVLYAGAGQLDIAAIRVAGVPSALALPAVGLLIAGFGVKAAIVPMHTWLPDAHSAAPSGISAMLSGVVIQGGLLAMVRALSVFGGGAAPFSYGLLLAFLAVLTMTIGNLLAMHQQDLKRLLAYSSIAQMGYILLGFGIGIEYGIGIAFVGALFHILSHALMKGGAFLAAGILQQAYGTRDLAGLRGAGRRVPAASLPFAVFALGLVGVPPTAGFLSKLLLATGAAEAGTTGAFFVVALIGNSVLSLAYYVPVLTGLFAREGTSPAVHPSPGSAVPVVGLAALVLLFGVWPDLVLGFVNAAAGSLGFGGP